MERWGRVAGGVLGAGSGRAQTQPGSRVGTHGLRPPLDLSAS